MERMGWGRGSSSHLCPCRGGWRPGGQAGTVALPQPNPGHCFLSLGNFTCSPGSPGEEAGAWPRPAGGDGVEQMLQVLQQLAGELWAPTGPRETGERDWGWSQAPKLGRAAATARMNVYGASPWTASQTRSHLSVQGPGQGFVPSVRLGKVRHREVK